jgi:hypothetical protein
MTITAIKDKELRKVVSERATEILAIMPAFDFGAASFALLNINREIGEEVIDEGWAENYLFNLAAAGLFDSIHNSKPIFRVPSYVATPAFIKNAVSFNMDTTRAALDTLLIRAEYGFNDPIKYGFPQIQDLMTAVLKVVVYKERTEDVDALVQIVSREVALGRDVRKGSALSLLRRYNASETVLSTVESA